MFRGREGVFFHDRKKGAEPDALDLGTTGHLRAFFFYVLRDGLAVEGAEGEAGDFFVGVEVVGEVGLTASLVALLVKVDGPDAVLDFLEVGGDVDDVVDGTHIA